MQRNKIKWWCLQKFQHGIIMHHSPKFLKSSFFDIKTRFFMWNFNLTRFSLNHPLPLISFTRHKSVSGSSRSLQVYKKSYLSYHLLRLIPPISLQNVLYRWNVSCFRSYWIILCMVGLLQNQQYGTCFRNLLLLYYGVPSSHPILFHRPWISRWYLSWWSSSIPMWHPSQ